MVLSNLKHNPSDINQKHKLLFGVCLHLNLLNLPPHWTVQGARQQQSGRLVSSLTTLLERIFSTKLSRKRLIWSLTRMLTYHESSCSISTPLQFHGQVPFCCCWLNVMSHTWHWFRLTQKHTPCPSGSAMWALSDISALGRSARTASSFCVGVMLSGWRSNLAQTSTDSLNATALGTWVASVVWTLDNNKFNLGCKFWSVQGPCKHCRLIMAEELKKTNSHVLFQQQQPWLKYWLMPE